MSTVKTIKIKKKTIGHGQPIFIIAEAGVNHNGDIGLAKKLIDVAKEAAADAVKFQTFKAENVVCKNVAIADYQRKNIGKQKSQLEMIREFELGYQSFIELKKYCDKKNIIFLSTPHSEDAIDVLEPLVSAYKVGSGDLTNLFFLKKIAIKKKPIILSTGMATLLEVREAVKVIKNQDNNKIILLHCTSNYPCSLAEVNLRAMKTMSKELNCLVGYSDHTLGMIVPVMAVILGAKLIEKHFTLDRSLPGPDHKASLEPNELKKMVKIIRETEKALGDGIKQPSKSEEKIKKIVRKSIVAKVDIPKENKIKKEMLIIKRPGTGIKPKYIDKIIGRVAAQNIKKDKLLRFNQLK